LGLDSRDDVVRLQVDLEPVSWLMSGLLARTPRASVPLHAHSAHNKKEINKKRREKRNKLLALVVCLFILFWIFISCDDRLIVTGIITNQNSWRDPTVYRIPPSLFLPVDGRQSLTVHHYALDLSRLFGG